MTDINGEPEPFDKNAEATGLILPNKIYHIFKQLALIVLPALSTLYFMLGGIYGWSNVTEVIGTIAAIEVFMGTVLGLSTRAFNNSDYKYDGVINASTTNEGVKRFTLELNDDPDTLELKDDILFKVNPGETE